MASALLYTYECYQNDPLSHSDLAMKKSSKGSRGYGLQQQQHASYMPPEPMDLDGKIPGYGVERSMESIGPPLHREVESTSDETQSLKRKSISLNADGVSDVQISFGGCAITVSNMSREERRELRKRLRVDLDQLKHLSVKIEAREQQLKSMSQSGMHATHSDAHLSRTENRGSAEKEVTSEPPSVLPELTIPSRLSRQASFVSDGNLGTPGGPGKEKRTPKANQLYLNSEFFSGKDKMPPPEKLKPKPALGSKKLGPPRSELEARRQKVESARNKRMADIMKQCGTILKKLMAHRHAWVFNEPVDSVKLNLHDYHKVIEKPMDLGTIKMKLDSQKYPTPVEFADDVHLTFSNAMKYNPKGHDVYAMADILRGLFDDRYKAIREKLEEEKVKYRAEEESLATANPCQIRELQDLKDHLRNIEDQLQSMKTTNSKGKPSVTSRPVAPPSKKKPDGQRRSMSFEDKGKLREHMENLPNEHLEGIVRIIRKRYPNLSENKEEIEVDIDSFDDDTLWELQRFVANCLKSEAKSKKKSSSQRHSMQENEAADDGKVAAEGNVDTPKKARRAGEPGDEDVDIDDDMPTTNFPPVVIDKDAGADHSKSSGSSSSSSDSGSSSSESDSGSSSGSESDAEDAKNAGASKMSPEKEPVGSGAVRDSKGSPAFENDAAKREDNDESASANPVPEDTDGHMEQTGEEERHISPDKKLRAALLKGRFADTILKAREKTFKSDNKVDPEKARKDREDLERLQREERARLQAEAKAAEVARLKVEAEAAYEARKKREAEREAARLALQQMEKTIDLGGSEVLKDFELLRTTSMEHLQSSAGEVSPASSPDGLQFTLQGGNPLEQLGLFMKIDEEEEEEKQGDGEVAYAEGTDENGEVEEGEID